MRIVGESPQNPWLQKGFARRLLVGAVVLSGASPLAACADADKEPTISCSYLVNPTEIPNPAFWAITERDGAQLIDPESELSNIIVKNLGTTSVDSIIDLGDIFVATENSFVINPESFGVKRSTISDCRPK